MAAAVNNQEAAILHDIYYSLASPACYSGVSNVLREARRRLPNLSRPQVEDWLSRQRTYTLYRHSVRRFPRLRTVPTGLNTDWQADLNDLQRLAPHNDGFRYALLCIDVLSRKLYVEPVKRKEARYMKPAFNAVFERAGVTPWKLYTDSGLEFESAQMRTYFKERNILKFHSSAERKLHAMVAERANRTVKDRLYKVFSELNTLHG